MSLDQRRLYEANIRISGTKDQLDLWTQNMIDCLPVESFEGLDLTLIAARWNIPARYELGDASDYAQAQAGDTKP